MDINSETNNEAGQTGLEIDPVVPTEWQVNLAQLNTAMMLLAMAFIFLVVAHTLALPNWTHLKQSMQLSWGVVILGLLLTPFCVIAAHVLKLLQLKYVGVDHAPDQPLPEISTSGKVFQAIFSGFPEEVLFRGVLMPIFGVWMSCIVFGLLHVDRRQDLPYGIYTFVCGLLFCLLYNCTGSLWVPIIVHVLNNYIASNPPLWWSELTMGLYSKVLDR